MLYYPRVILVTILLSILCILTYPILKKMIYLKKIIIINLIRIHQENAMQANLQYLIDV